MDNFNKLKILIADMEKDVIKFYENNNKSAGARIRKNLQEIKSYSQIIKTETLTKNNE